MSLRVRFWIVAIVPLLLAVFLITWLFSTNMWNIYLQERRETKLQGVLNLMVKNFEAVAPQQDKDSLITNALRGDVQLSGRSTSQAYRCPATLQSGTAKMQCPHWGCLTQFLC